MSVTQLLLFLAICYTSIVAITYGIVRQTVAIPKFHAPMSILWPVSIVFLIVVAFVARLVRVGDRIGVRLCAMITG